MKRLISLVSIIIIIFFFSGCYNFDPDYTYKWDIEVTYTNGDIDTISCGRDSFKGNEVSLYLSARSSGFSGSGSACVYMSCGMEKEAIVCGVRKFDIICEQKELIE